MASCKSNVRVTIELNQRQIVNAGFWSCFCIFVVLDLSISVSRELRCMFAQCWMPQVQIPPSSRTTKWFLHESSLQCGSSHQLHMPLVLDCEILGRGTPAAVLLIAVISWPPDLYLLGYDKRLVGKGALWPFFAFVTQIVSHRRHKPVLVVGLACCFLWLLCLFLGMKSHKIWNLFWKFEGSLAIKENDRE